MNRDVLYLLKPGFMDGMKGPYFCPGCAQMVGLLELYPALKQTIEVRWLDFPRPRPELINLLGEENQSCPVLVLQNAPTGLPSSLPIQQAKGRWFIEGANEIATTLPTPAASEVPIDLSSCKMSRPPFRLKTNRFALTKPSRATNADGSARWRSAGASCVWTVTKAFVPAVRSLARMIFGLFRTAFEISESCPRPNRSPSPRRNHQYSRTR